MSDQPLGVRQLMQGLLPSPKLPDHWYWCRQHERAEHVSQSPTQWSVDPPLIKTECVRIGPFMSEREANRLNGDPGIPAVVYELPPLGMEVEQ